MVLRHPDLFLSTMKEELLPADNNGKDNIFNTCRPIFYAAGACMGTGPNILKPNFDKVFLIIRMVTYTHHGFKCVLWLSLAFLIAKFLTTSFAVCV